MGILKRLTRALDALSNVRLDEVSAYGARGEATAQGVLSGEDYYSFFNRIIPHPRERGRFLETDAIIYAEGNVFCVEVKRYKGKIYFPRKTREVQRRKNLLIFDYEAEEMVTDGYDESRIIKEKMGNYGEGVFRKEFPNPLKKTKYYIHHLKQFLSRIDERFSGLFIIPVVGFSDAETDILAIHSMDQGLVYVSEIPGFIKCHRNERFANSPSRWIVDGLRQLPTWDRIQTRENEWLHGIILDDDFSCKTVDGQQYRIPYKHTHSISVSRKGMFSAYDDIQVIRIDGKKVALASSNGRIKFDKFGERQVHKLRNINKVSVGTQSLR